MDAEAQVTCTGLIHSRKTSSLLRLGKTTQEQPARSTAQNNKGQHRGPNKPENGAENDCQKIINGAEHCKCKRVQCSIKRERSRSRRKGALLHSHLAVGKISLSTFTRASSCTTVYKTSIDKIRDRLPKSHQKQKDKFPNEN